MGERLTDRLVKTLPAPPTGSKITYDSEVAGFAVRVTAAGARAFILRYRVGSRGRLLTIGGFPDWSSTAAREEAKALKRRIDRGEDPMGERHEARAAPTVGDLCDRYITEHLPKKRPLSQRDFRAIINTIIRPTLGSSKVADVQFADIERVHRELSLHAPVRANRVVSLLRSLFNIAIKWGWRPDNPCRGIEFNHEDRRERYLSSVEMAYLSNALRQHRDQRSADAIRLLMLTGARRGEVFAATWDQFDLGSGTWVKPSAATKQKRLHRVPLSAPAVQLLVEIRQRQNEAEQKTRRAGERVTSCHYVFPGDVPGAHITDVKNSWGSLTATATVLQWADQPETPAGQLVARLRAAKPKGTLPTLAECRAAAKAQGWELPPGLTNARVHDLRHCYASILVSQGMSLQIIGALLGHSQISTTHRYSHLFDDVLRAATERVGAAYEAASAAKKPAQVVPIHNKR
jgi:integrase